MKNNINIAIVGLGQIGIYLYNELNLKKKEIFVKTGKNINIVAISAKNRNKKRRFKINNKIFFSNPLKIFKEKKIDILFDQEDMNPKYVDSLTKMAKEIRESLRYLMEFKGKLIHKTEHTVIHKQMEMLQQQILADEHGLDFKAFIPKAKMPNMLKRQQITDLTKEDVMRLTSMGWTITPPTPAKDAESQMAELVRLNTEIQLNTERINHLLKGAQGEE